MMSDEKIELMMKDFEEWTETGENYMCRLNDDGELIIYWNINDYELTPVNLRDVFRKAIPLRHYYGPYEICEMLWSAYDDPEKETEWCKEQFELGYPRTIRDLIRDCDDLAKTVETLGTVIKNIVDKYIDDESEDLVKGIEE